jgi:hypothetical protein
VTELRVVKSRRSYTKRQKITAVIAAEMTTQASAAEQAGIPRKTLAYWFDDPAFAVYRQKLREDLGPESMALAHNVLAEIQRRLPEFEPRDLATLYGILYDKAALMAGQATARTETRQLTDGLDDHEKAALRAVLDDLLKAEVK